MKKYMKGSVILLLICVLFAAACFTVLSPCGIHEDGAYSTCHWAGIILKALSVVMIIQCLSSAAFNDVHYSAGVSFCVAAEAVLAFLIPGNLIKLCMMDTMRCNLIMKPGTIVFGAVILIVSLVSAVRGLKVSGKGKNP